MRPLLLSECLNDLSILVSRTSFFISSPLSLSRVSQNDPQQISLATKPFLPRFRDNYLAVCIHFLEDSVLVTL